MLFGAFISGAIGFGIGYGLGRVGRYIAAGVLLLSVAPLAALWVYQQTGQLTGERNEGIFAVLAIILLGPCAVGMFVGSWFRD